MRGSRAPRGRDAGDEALLVLVDHAARALEEAPELFFDAGEAAVGEAHVAPATLDGVEQGRERDAGALVVDGGLALDGEQAA